jgi:ribose 5-phosphate isomerase B
MKIAVCSDHAGFAYKQALVTMLGDSGHEVLDMGTHSDEATDYPQWIRPVALAVAGGQAQRGIVLGGSGNGEAMVANRVPRVRCAYCFNEESARLARRHNDANCIAIGQRLVPLEMARRIVAIFLTEPFDAGRHLRRIQQIDAM